MKKHMKSLLCALLAIFILVSLCACGAKKDGDKKNNTQTDYTSLYEYAEQLEKAGNSEAAAAVYELIAKGGGAELIQKAHENNSVIEKTDEVEQIEGIFDNTKGDSGK